LAKALWKSKITIQEPEPPRETVVVASGNYFDAHGKFIPKPLADEIMSQHRFVTMMDNEDIYIHMDGFYRARRKSVKTGCSMSIGRTALLK